MLQDRHERHATTTATTPATARVDLDHSRCARVGVGPCGMTRVVVSCRPHLPLETPNHEHIGLQKKERQERAHEEPRRPRQSDEQSTRHLQCSSSRWCMERQRNRRRRRERLHRAGCNDLRGDQDRRRRCEHHHVSAPHDWPRKLKTPGAPRRLARAETALARLFVRPPGAGAAINVVPKHGPQNSLITNEPARNVSASQNSGEPP
jgi:hypothetical protein